VKAPESLACWWPGGRTSGGLSKQVRLIGSVDAPMPTQRAGVGSDPKEELGK
jgi:hypothetical protein